MPFPKPAKSHVVEMPPRGIGIVAEPKALALIEFTLSQRELDLINMTE